MATVKEQAASAEAQAVNPAVLGHRHRGWRRMLRIGADGGELAPIAASVSDFMPAKLLYAEGDSWLAGAGAAGSAADALIPAIRTPFLTAVVDASQPGLALREAIHGHRLRRTRAMFAAFGFDAVLLSIGGKDLIDAIVERAELEAEARAAGAPPSAFATGGFAPGADPLAGPGERDGPIDWVVRSILRFVDLRDGAGDPVTRRAPIFVNGYEWLQPRACALHPFSREMPAGGPWLHPALVAAGFDGAQMRRCVEAVVDALHARLHAAFAERSNVVLVDQRGLLDAAAPGSTDADGDWLDEIHPSPAGFTKLARHRWDVALSRALGWSPKEGDLVPAQTGLRVAAARKE
ncbi:MAG TPA: hypothetical protein VFR90_07875 [Methylibium sp.]|uniref:hypothetical protein n=1 Tax=Methylibium sp. TaxID=2067992 RepID=UPI002DBD1040|nr:hypothetical protein [Methylibium sp.]HEU4459024.1 hypothetical protein [Methylibium sp.]